MEDGSRVGGVLFKLTRGGVFTKLYAFPNPEEPNGPLVQGEDGNFYGTTYFGGAFGNGTVFKATPTGSVKIIHDFCSDPDCHDGALPFANLTRSADGGFYGTTTSGGYTDPGQGLSGSGTVFKIAPDGQFTTIYRFCSQIPCTDGKGPASPLVLASPSLSATVPAGATTGHIQVTLQQGKLSTIIPFPVL